MQLIITATNRRATFAVQIEERKQHQAQLLKKLNSIAVPPATGSTTGTPSAQVQSVTLMAKDSCWHCFFPAEF